MNLLMMIDILIIVAFNKFNINLLRMILSKASVVLALICLLSIAATKSCPRG
jgi:hypothetical protein